MAPIADPILPGVRAGWLAFNEPFEGRCNFMYLDVRGLVTTGVGNLIDPITSATSLPWLRADMSPATRADIVQAWNTVKARTDLCQKGGGAYKALTTLRLSEGAIDQLVMRRLTQMGYTIQSMHPCFALLPADAQTAILSMAWAMGPAFHFPKFWAAIEDHDFATAANECDINPKVGTIVLRNKANREALLRCVVPEAA